MSIAEQLTEEEQDAIDVAERLARETVPGTSNDGIVSGLEKSHAVVQEVNRQINNWFEIIHVTVHDENRIGIACKYRWTIIRWSNNDMDRWLLDNGWKNQAHLNADTRERRERDMEARYRKVVDGVVVDCNFLVEFPDIVFEKMNSKGYREIRREKEEEKEKSEKLQKFIQMKRNNG